MANSLTGDFDVVAEFSIPGVNRVLAAMHSSERFLHSISARVDDNPPPGLEGVQPTVVGSVDAFGDATVNHSHIGRPDAFPGMSAATDATYSALGLLLNPDVVGALEVRPVPSHIQGRAQLQLFPPTIEVPDASGSRVTVRINIMSRFFPDPQTPPLAEFIRGDLQITAAVNQVVSPDPNVPNVVDIDFKAEQAQIGFTPAFSSQPLSAADLAGIHLCIRNALKTSFLPSTAPLPSQIKFVRFKTLFSGQHAVALLLNIHGVPLTDMTGAVIPGTSGPGDPATMNNLFVASGDDFALAVSRDFILGAFHLGTPQFDPVGVSVPIWGSTTYTISLTGDPTIDLQEQKIVLTITGHAHSSKNRFPSFNFQSQVTFTLRPVATSPGGVLDTAQLFLQDVSLDFIDTGAGGWIKDQVLSLFKGTMINNIRTTVENILNPPNPQPGDPQPNRDVRQMLSVQTNLGDFLNSLLRAPNPTPIFRPGQTFQLAYTKVDIHAAGIVLHGSLSVTDQQLVKTVGIAFFGLAAGWPPAHVEYEQIPAIVHQGVLPPVGPFPQGPDYSALKSWIPGGTVQQYEWSRQGQTQPFVVDPNRFVLISSESEPPETMYSAEVVPAYAPLCLTVRGTRLSASGPVVPQPVSATLCGYSRMPVIDSGLLATLEGALPMLALTQPGTGGGIVVTGHTPAQSGNAVPNLLVHFADDQTAGQLEIFTRALRDNKRKDAVVAVLAVLSPEQISKARHTQDVIYADNQDGAWERVFQVKTARRPLTAIVGQKGGVAWQLEGIPDAKILAAAVGKYLMPGGSSKLEIQQANVRIGQPAPNFLFEFAPGRQLTLRKLAGRPAILVFWRTSSQPSIEAIRALQQGADKAGAKGSAVLAVNDGEAADLAKRVALGNGLSATLVTDPKREISLAYGVSLWPTVVYIDASGSITGISYGYFTGEHGETTSAGRTAA